MTVAEFESKCPGCGDLIYEGEDIHRVDGEWVCDSCAENAGVE